MTGWDKICSSPLLRVLRTPTNATGFTNSEWETLHWQARTSHLAGRIWYSLDKLELLDAIPKPIERRLRSAFIEGEFYRRGLLWEVNRLHRTFQDTGLTFILLKGAAYAAAGLDIALGRPTSDIDIMVPQETIIAAEQILLCHGWEQIIDNDYDQKYYRRWMHELPPLRHTVRDTELDLHHGIVPRTSRLKPNMRLIYSAASVIDEYGTKTLAPIDMFLHCAVHLFHEGEIQGALRDLVDLDALLRWIGPELGLWDALVPRARELGLERPLFYALHYVSNILQAKIPAAISRAAAHGRPPLPVLGIMNRVVPAALDPTLAVTSPWSSRISTLALKSRAHWLRMDPPRLILHLARKSARRLTEA